MHQLLRLNYRDPQERDRSKCHVSYSQFAMYMKCPKQWELSYIKRESAYEPSIHTVFGTAMHEVFQEYIRLMYEDSVKAANQLGVEQFLKQRMAAVYKEELEKYGQHISTKKELNEFYSDGVEILNWFLKRRGGYFNSKNFELLGIEVPILHQASETNEHVQMLGYLDLVLRDKRDGQIIIYDIKTSTNGWNKYQKADKLKQAQLVLYKKYFAEQYGLNVDNIKIVFFIVKRKLIEGAMFPQKRIVEYTPPSGKPSRNKFQKQMDSFIESSFLPDGSYNTDKTYLAIAGKASKNCKYCPFKEQLDLCPKENRIKDA